MEQKYLHKIIILFFALIFVKPGFSQKETHKWLFGANAGLDFSSGAPVPITHGKLNTSEGCSSIADSSGNLLFYTDGRQVWNRNHVQMPKGSGLFGHYSSTQSALIVQKPKSKSIYYIFTTCAEAGVWGVRYSEVDMNMEAGLGDVVKKNTLLYSPACEKLAAIRHENGRDIWVVTHAWNSNAFKTYLLTACGLESDPVISNVGLVASGYIGNAIGQLKGSPDGTKLASAMEKCSFELFDFNNKTGVISNPLLIPKISEGCYSVEFSPDNKKLYGVTAVPHVIYQFDLNAGNNTDIIQSGMVVGTSSTLFGALQLAPDKKIYVARGGYNWLGVIKNPNQKGTGCDYNPTGASLGKMCMYGLPNFVNCFGKSPSVPFSFSTNCLEAKFTLPNVGGYNSVDWNFGDPVSGYKNFSNAANPTHYFVKPGSYEVTLVLHYNCYDEVIKKQIIMDKPPVSSAKITGISEHCVNQSVVLGANVQGSYLWSSGETTSTITTDPITKTYNVTITTSAGCSYTAAKSVTVHPLPVIKASAIPIEELSSRLMATGGVSYKWLPSPELNCTLCQSPIAVYPGSAQFCVEGTDEFGCVNSDCVNVFVSSAFIPNSFTPNQDNLNEVFLPVVREVHDYRFLVFDRWGKKIFETSQPGVGWDGRYKDEMCEEAVYVYKVMLTNNTDNELHEYVGKVTLIR